MNREVSFWRSFSEIFFNFLKCCLIDQILIPYNDVANDDDKHTWRMVIAEVTSVSKAAIASPIDLLFFSIAAFTLVVYFSVASPVLRN